MILRDLLAEVFHTVRNIQLVCVCVLGALLAKLEWTRLQVGHN